MTAIRQHKDPVQNLNPITPLSGTVKYLMQTEAEQQIVMQPLGTARAAWRPVAWDPVTVIEAGETASAANFALATPILNSPSTR